MRRYLLIIYTLAPLLLGSCSLQDPIDPDTPGFVTYTITGDHLRLQIHSNQPTATLTHTVREWRGTLIIDDHYYSCISLAIDPASEIEITDGTSICKIYVDQP